MLEYYELGSYASENGKAFFLGMTLLSLGEKVDLIEVFYASFFLHSKKKKKVSRGLKKNVREC